MVVKREIRKKIAGLFIAVFLLLLIFSILIPPGVGVYVHPGTPDDTSLTKGQTVIFNNVNLTIRAAERIPVEFLNFTIFTSTNQYVTHVIFNITGHELTDPNSKFTVTAITNVSNLTYSEGGTSFGYDEISSQNITDFGSGYGPDDPTEEDLTIIYRIVYTTHETGTFKARLLVNASTYDYISGYSTSFSVTYTSGGGGDPPPAPPADDEEEEEEEDEEESTIISEETLEDIEDLYDITLNQPFYGNDTDGDGIIDTFTDPNNILTSLANVNLSGHSIFLITTSTDDIPEFYWDTTTNTITLITHAPGTITDEYMDTEEETITISVSVTKSNWIFIELIDPHPELPSLTVKNQNGTIIPNEQIWRRNGKIYVLDDPDTLYAFIFSYTLLEPTFEPVSGTTFDISKPTITITYNEPIQITLATFGINEITDQLTTTDNQIYIYQPTTDLPKGTYTLTIIAEDQNSNRLTSTAQYTINVEPAEPEPEFPWLIILLIIIIIVIIVLLYLFKTGYLYIYFK